MRIAQIPIGYGHLLRVCNFGPVLRSLVLLRRTISSGSL